MKNRGAWLAQWVKHCALDFWPGGDEPGGSLLSVHGGVQGV